MTPEQFAAAYFSTADKVKAGTGIDPTVLLAQWSNETAWGTAVFANNLGNIRCTPTAFCQYATLDDFANGCIATFHNGFYAAVLAATTPLAQLAAIVASPWSSGHYGGSLLAFYLPLEELMNIFEKRAWVLMSFVAGLGRTPESAARVGTRRGHTSPSWPRKRFSNAVRTTCSCWSGTSPRRSSSSRAGIGNGAAVSSSQSPS